MFQNIPVQIKAELEGGPIAKDHHFLLLYYTIYSIYTHTHAHLHGFKGLSKSTNTGNLFTQQALLPLILILSLYLNLL